MTRSRQAGTVRAVAGAAIALVGAVAQAGEFDCVIEPRQVVAIRATVSGLIERVSAERGDFVAKGQALVVLDSSVERAAADVVKFRAETMGAVRSAESRVELFSQKLKRKNELHAQNYTSAQDRDEAANEKRLAEAELLEALDNKRATDLEHRRAVEQLRQRTLRSPFAGVVTERSMHPGDVADVGDAAKPILKLAEIDVLNVEVLLPVEAYGAVRLGEEFDVRPEAPLKGRYRAKVAVVDRVLDAASGTFGVRLELPNPKREIPAGVRCKVEMPGAAAGARAVPAARRAATR